MPRPPTDYRTYPDDRHTRLTPAQRDAKRAKATRLLAEAMTLLGDVFDDFTANGYRLTHTESAEWRAIATATDRTRDAHRALTD